MSRTLLSILICTRNRADELSSCLASVSDQARRFEDVEVIVVDNGSTDNTGKVVAAFSKETGYGIRYILEPVPGLCQARNRGRAEAHGKVLAYIDDDALLEPRWVAGVREHFLNKKSDCLGGKVTANFIGESAFKIDESVLWFFQATAYGSEPRPLVYPEHPIGCNMAFTIGVFDSIGGFDTNLQLYGDETDFFRRASEAGFTIWYDPAIVVDQNIPEERLTKSAIRSKSFKWGQGSATLWLLTRPDRFSKIKTCVPYILAAIKLGLSTKLSSDFGRYFTFWFNRGFISRSLRGID